MNKKLTILIILSIVFQFLGPIAKAHSSSEARIINFALQNKGFFISYCISNIARKCVDAMAKTSSDTSPLKNKSKSKPKERYCF